MPPRISQLSKNFPKYDILLKKAFSVPNSGLKWLLSIPPEGERRSEELSGLAGLTVDSLTEYNGVFYHVEFQSKNQAEMPWRMLGYYQGIIEDYFGNALHEGERRVVQTVLYIGESSPNMVSRISQDSLRFRFTLRDIKEFEAAADELLRSDNPQDWIIGVLCKRSVDINEWRRVALRIRNISRQKDWFWREASAMFLIAAILRRLPPTELNEFEKVLQVNIEESALFKDVYDQGFDLGYGKGHDSGFTSACRRVIDAKLKAENITDEVVKKKLDTLDEEALGDLAERAVQSADFLSDILGIKLPSPGPR